MLSGQFTNVPVETIIVLPDRQRKEIDEGHIQSLAESIRVRGLIHPIVIRRDHTLVAGECRLRAHQLLGFDHILVQYVEDMPEIELELLELEENVKRKNLTWQEEVLAVVRYHKTQKTAKENWTIAKTAEELGMSDASVINCILVERNFDIEEVAKATNFSTAKNFASRREERQQTQAKRELNDEISATFTPVEKTITEVGAPNPRETPRAEIVCQSALEWFQAPTLTGINFLHCDFPYGIGTGDKIGQSGAKAMGGYADGAEIYFELLEAMTAHQEKFLSSSSHLIFWFSMTHYVRTREILEAAGWRVFLPLLIWHKSDNAGILADPARVPRNITEVALLASFGDRKIVRSVANAYSGPTTKKFHMSEKPYAMLSHFFRMFVDESTVMLDPTCGSGMAIKVSNDMGARNSLGLELNPDYALDAKRNLEE